MSGPGQATDAPVFPRRQPSCSLTRTHGCKQWTGCQKWRDAHPDEPYTPHKQLSFPRHPAAG
jgi:hypothetical protein